ncbi:hypothetical protein H920_09386 [Fukomys damarensis]|uniref:Uncharacterized protein n=1 Tax=Fukomys damarensis TaxID=885580 RepID=A0A091DFJ9_FUKDA|nr:hypothetical protein H920_09386 [Fukomys damarensis]
MENYGGTSSSYESFHEDGSRQHDVEESDIMGIPFVLSGLITLLPLCHMLNSLKNADRNTTAE